MSAERPTYLDSSAIAKLAVAEPESAALRRYLRRRRPPGSNALATAEVGRALLPLGEQAVRRGQEVLAHSSCGRSAHPPASFTYREIEIRWHAVR
jgi:predicted nucleic acid-binding protein